MQRALFTAASGMAGQQLNIDVIANNLANVNTTGFKKSRIDFQDVLYQTARVPGSPSAQGSQVPTGIQVGLGVRPGSVYKHHLQGAFSGTGNQLDLAIEGDGFFQVAMPDGSVAYTRDGAFKLDEQGRLVTNDGYPLVPEITIENGVEEIAIGGNGIVSVKRAGQTEMEEIGQIELATFVNPAGLLAEGNNLLVQSAASGDPQVGGAGEESRGMIRQSFLEMSNVDIVSEMVQMIVAMRAYEVNSKAIQTSDEMLQVANNVRR